MRGRKRHLLVDTEGLVLKAKIHSAKVPDQDGLKEGELTMTAYIITAIFESTGQRYVASGSWIYREEAEETLPIIADLVGLTDVRIESVESLR